MVLILVRFYNNNVSTAVAQLYANEISGKKVFATIDVSQSYNEMEINYDSGLVYFNKQVLVFYTSYG